MKQSFFSTIYLRWQEVPMEKAYLSSGSKVKEKWESNKFRFVGEQQSCDQFSRPPISNYTCSFCKRQFRSAQALGGHMNVHRRDRARLRQLPPWFFSCPNITNNPNPSPTSNLNSSKVSPSSSTQYSSKLLPYLYSHNHFLLSSSPTPFSPRSHGEKKPIVDHPPSPCRSFGPQRGGLDEERKMKSNNAQKNELVPLMKKGEVINLNLEMGLKDPKEVLDLDLRLGYL